MALARTYPRQDCSLAGALEIVGERWTLLVLRDCFYGLRRFSDFQTHLDIPRAVLAERLKHLVAEGLLERRAGPTGPEYRLTEAGVGLWPTVYALAQWGEQHLEPAAGPRRLFNHVPCETDLEPHRTVPPVSQRPPPGRVSDPPRARRRPRPARRPRQPGTRRGPAPASQPATSHRRAREW